MRPGSARTGRRGCVGDPLDRGRAAADRRWRQRVDQAARRQHGVDGAEAAAVVRDGRVRDGAHDVVDGGQGRGRDGVNGPRTWGLVPVKSKVIDEPRTVTATAIRTGRSSMPSSSIPVGEGIGAIGDRLDAPPGEDLRALGQIVDVAQHRVGPRSARAALDVIPPSRPAATWAIQVAGEHVRDAHVAPEEERTGFRRGAAPGTAGSGR